MAQRPTFDMSKLTTADRILLGAGALFFIDTFLRWQKFFCIKSVFISGCATASAWNGNGGFAGVLAALFSLALIAWIILHVAGVNLEFGVPASTIASVLVLGTVLFAIIKFLFVIGNHSSYGAWIGLILALVIAYGGYMKMQEPKTAGSAPPAMGGPPPPPPA